LLDFFESDRRLWGRFQDGDDFSTPDDVAVQAVGYLKAHFAPVQRTARDIRNHLKNSILPKYKTALKLDLYTTGWGNGFNRFMGLDADGNTIYEYVEDTEGEEIAPFSPTAHAIGPKLCQHVLTGL
jgi:hypothetical protein